MIGQSLGPYHVLARLGEGGMGEVYRARDTRLGREVAIKVLPPTMALEPDRLARFELEARAAAALNHPNITVLYDIGTYTAAGTSGAIETRPYLVTELLERATIRDLLSAGPLPVRKAVEYGKQVALGLAAAHEKGIVHRDLKPENVFITSNDRAKILDFGLAKLTEADPVPVGASALGMLDDVQVALGRIGPGNNGADVWTIRLDTGATTRVAAGSAWEDHGRWSRDGRRLLFRSGDTLKMAEIGSNLPPKSVIESIPGLERLDDWSPDERHVLVSAVTAERRYDILSIDLQAGGAPVGVAATPATESFARFSPDATMVAYVSDTSGPPECTCSRFPARPRLSACRSPVARFRSGARTAHACSSSHRMRGSWKRQSRDSGVRSPWARP